MSSLQEYYQALTTEQLEEILRADFEGIRECSVEDLLLICNILAARNPKKSDPHEAYRIFCKYYMPGIS